MDDVTMLRALERYPTPFYLFDEMRFGEDVRHLRSLLPARAQLCYAMKANPFMVECAARHVGRIEVCSPGELRICQAMDVPEEKLVISGVHKDRALMRELVAESPRIARYTVESPLQFDLLEETASELGRRVPLLLRLTSGNQFGLSEADTRRIAAMCAGNPHVELCGIQLFSGTQTTSAKQMRRQLDLAQRLIASLERNLGIDLEEFELEFGPGLPVHYFEHEQDAAHLQDEIAIQLANMLDDMTFPGRIVLELGRSMAAHSGWYATRIVDMKRNGTGRYAIVDGGKHQISYFGNAMAMREPPCHQLPRRTGSEPEEWSICGSLCTTNDVLAKRLQLHNPQLGDVMVFERSGAYCMTEGMSLFLSRDLPRVIMRDEAGELRLVRDSFDTYLLNAPFIIP